MHEGIELMLVASRTYGTQAARFGLHMLLHEAFILWWLSPEHLPAWI
jgi:hypothetical protein